MQTKKILGVGLAFLILLHSVTAISYEIGWHNIELAINADGTGKITEKFYINFDTPADLNEFKQITSKFGIDIANQWKAFNPKLQPNIGKFSDITPGSGKIALIEVEDSYLELSYELKEPLFEKIEETSRSTVFELKKPFFNSFLSKPFYVIPAKTAISFILPEQTTVTANNVLPKGEIQTQNNKTVVIWTGEKTTTDLAIKFTYWKQIAPNLSLAIVIKEFLENTPKELLILLIIIFVLAVSFFYLKRKEYGKKVSDYIVKHSEL
ncbi:MAG: hypothetical protein Q7S92_00615 [Candidatus Diapherotrites archaeon]|nr:hypothetical protein [Candidatus Diapherotrites archaeon]